MNYAKLSRKALIGLAEDFDEANNMALSNFAEAQEKQGVSFPLVKPFIIKIEKAEDVLSNTATVISDKIDNALDKANNLINTFANIGGVT